MVSTHCILQKIKNYQKKFLRKEELYLQNSIHQKAGPENFIQRNRIVAGISPATIVVETAFGGGSISTATLPISITEKYLRFREKLQINRARAVII
jgi:hypothetical protein